MDLCLWRDGADQAGYPNILDNKGVDAGLHDRGNRLSRLGKLAIKDKGIKGQVAAHAPAMQGAHHLRQLLVGEADLGAGRKMCQAKVDGVGASLDRSIQLGPVACRAHNFWFCMGVWHSILALQTTM